jgi:chromosome partitioning protein
MMGYRVLFIDADPQSTASGLLGVDSAYREATPHVGYFLTKKAVGEPDGDLKAAIVPIYEGGFLDLLPADITLAESDTALVGVMASHERALRFFRRNGEMLRNTYDVIVVDTAPGTTLVSMAFTFAAKEAGKVLVIVEPEGMCLRALDSLANNLGEIREVTGEVIGMEVVVNKHHMALTHIKESMGFLYSRYGAVLNDTIIPTYSGFSRQINPNTRKAIPLVESEPSSPGALAIFEVAQSLVSSFSIQSGGAVDAAQGRSA